MTLAEALAQVELVTGKMYQTRVNDKWVQVRVFDASQLPAAAGVNIEEAMMDAWFDTPQTAPVRLIKAMPLHQVYPKPIVITEDDLAPGDLP